MNDVNKKEFMIGCNYWDSASGTDMWRNWKEEVVRKDLAALKACGVRHLRVFPNWRDFQPVDKYWGWSAKPAGYYTPKEAECQKPDYVDMRMVRRFRKFAEIAAENDMELTVSLLTGWMSGRLFFPPALANKNIMTDPEALALTNRYITKLVTEFCDIENIVMWDLGNECNCMQRVANKDEAYVWTYTVSNAIRAIDKTRPIASGMHALAEEDECVWSIKDQGELCDMLTTHPYPSPTIKNDIEPANKMRSTIFPTAQSEFYAGVSNRPCMIQEQGSFSDLSANPEMAADFARVNIFSAWANNLKGYLWWCGMEHLLLEEPPYNWSMIERSLGMLKLDRTPKKIGEAFRKASEVIKELPVVYKKRTDAVCLLTDRDRQEKGMVSYVLAKQAGINIEFKVFGDKLPQTDLILVPSCHGDTFFDKETSDEIFERVKNGTTLFMSASRIHMCEFEEHFGLRSLGMAQMGCTHTAHFPFGDITYTSEKEILLESAGAQILAANEQDNPVFTKFQYGKGYVYLLNFDLELSAVRKYDAFNQKPHIAGIYKMVDKVRELAADYKIYTDDVRVGVTELDTSDGLVLALINYSDEDISDFRYCVKAGYKVEILYGNLEQIPHCDAVLVKVTEV